MDIRLGDILTLKKAHPCGSREWQVLRIGADFKLRCCGCGHEVMGARARFEKSVRQIRRPDGDGAAVPAAGEKDRREHGNDA